MQKANKTCKFFPVVWNYLSTENSMLDVIGLTIAEKESALLQIQNNCQLLK